MTNNTLLQYFEWYLPNDGKLWKQLIKDVEHLKILGVTHIWLPPAYKGAGGISDVGYGVYDLYDLGEFNQKGSIPTKYGTKDEYLRAIKALQSQNIKVLADIVFNHKLGADETEEVLAIQDNSRDKEVNLEEAKPIKAWTKYTFPGRGDKYSSFKWNWTHFHGVDWDEKTGTESIYRFYGKHWDENVDKENGNFDYLMGADIDLNNFDVVSELKSWGKWYLDFTNVDGFRLDAIKHIRTEFFPEWLDYLREETGKELFSIGEYWSANLDVILEYMEKTNNCMSLFDVPLHFNLYKASTSNGDFDMRTIFNGTLVEARPEQAITFVNNHDTEPGQSLESNILDWFKPQAYSLILLRKDGLPCVFYGDYYGIPSKDIKPSNVILDIILNVRRNYAYGEQHDYFIDENLIGFTRLGDKEHKDSGLAVVLTDKLGGSIKMHMGKNKVGKEYIDCTQNVKGKVIIDKDGDGIFSCKDGSVSIWVLNNP